MLQWRNWHTRQIQTLFSPGSTPGWSTIFEINSGGDFVNNISAVAIGMLIAAHREGDEQKFKTYVDFIAKAYEEQGNDRAANIIRLMPPNMPRRCRITMTSTMLSAAHQSGERSGNIFLRRTRHGQA